MPVRIILSFTLDDCSGRELVGSLRLLCELLEKIDLLARNFQVYNWDTTEFAFPLFQQQNLNFDFVSPM